jgi:hypothetical protein
VFIVVNSKLNSEFAVVSDSFAQLALRSVATMIKADIRSTLIANYDFARRKGWEFNLVAAGFPAPSGLDPADTGRASCCWQPKHPQGFIASISVRLTGHFGQARRRPRRVCPS